MTRFASAVIAAAFVIALAGCSGQPVGPAGGSVDGTFKDGAVQSLLAPTGSTPEKRDLAPLEPSTPVRVFIPAIAVDADLMKLGLRGDGSLEVPPAAYPAGWYTGSPTPGELGPSIIAGHVDYNDETGVFADLARLKAGDRVLVKRKDRSTAVFEVTRLARFAKDQFPTDAVYGDIDHPGLRLITCGGYDAGSGEWEQNVVAFAELVDAEQP